MTIRSERKIVIAAPKEKCDFLFCISEKNSVRASAYKIHAKTYVRRHFGRNMAEGGGEF